jgi:methionine biosynthesis protein MetW
MQQNYHQNSSSIRLDLKLIADMIEDKSKVLDIGCGDGELLDYLKKNKNIDARGLEISHVQVSKALTKGLSVIQGNAESDLNIYPEKSFDYAVLSQTIQATNNPPKIILEMLRIAKYAVISLPNFAHIQNRFDLMVTGKMPVNKSMPYQWYETPNIHFCSIKDFENLCRDLNLCIEKVIYLGSNYKKNNNYSNKFFANLFARYGIFLITKNDFRFSGQEEFAFKGVLNLGCAKLKPNSLSKVKIDD